MADFVTTQMVLQMVSAELQSFSTHNHTPSKQMRIIATGLLALNLASITGVSSESRIDETVH